MAREGVVADHSISFRDQYIFWDWLWENLIVFIVIVNVTIRRRPWSARSQSIQRLVTVFKPPLCGALTCINSPNHLYLDMYLHPRVPIFWGHLWPDICLFRDLDFCLRLHLVLRYFGAALGSNHVLIWRKCPYLFLYCTLRWEPGHSIFTSS